MIPRTLVAALILIPAAAFPQSIVAAPSHTSTVDGFIVTEGDISDRPYTVIGSVKAKVGNICASKGTNTDMVDAKLRREGRKLGADSVIRVRYGRTGASLLSGGGMKANGAAIKFVVR